MDASTLHFGILTDSRVGATFRAWRRGNEKRDGALLGLFRGPCGVGNAFTAIL